MRPARSAPPIAIALATTALLEHQVLVGGLAVVVAATCLGFLVYNWHPAAIFMGDAGSLFLGFLLAVIALKLRTGVPIRRARSRWCSSSVPRSSTPPSSSSRAPVRAVASTSAAPITHRTGWCSSAFRPAGATVSLIVATASCATLGVLVAEGLVTVALAAPSVAIGAVVGLAFMLRVGEYKPTAGRSELTRASYTQVGATAVAGD